MSSTPHRQPRGELSGSGLVGRDPALAALLAALARAEEGDAVLVTVTGEAGVGKSALVDAAFQPLRDRAIIFAAGAFDPPGAGDPLAAIVDACRALCRDLEGLPRARLQGWRERLGASMGATMPALVALLPEVAAVVGPQEPPPPLPLADAIHRDRLTLQRFLHTFADAEHPLVLFVDNLHAADEATFEFLRALVDDRASHHLLLITAYREASLEAEHPLHRLIGALRRGPSPPLAIALGPLGELAIRELVAASLPGLAPGTRIDDLAEVLLLHTRGNPRFIHELLGALIREGRLGLDPRRGALVITPAAGETLPESVVDLVARQLQRLPEATLSLVGDAALLGYRFSLQALAAVAKERELQELQELRGRLEPALAGGLLVGDPAGDRLRFAHSQVREVAVAMLPPAAVAAAQVRIGRGLLRQARAEAASETLKGETLLSIVPHLNAGATLLAPEERAELAALDLEAAQASTIRGAYTRACELLEEASALVTASGAVTVAPAIAFAIESERIACLHLAGASERALARLGAIERQALKLEERLRLADLRVILEVSAGDTEAALATGRAALAAAGIELPRAAAACHAAVEGELSRIARHLAELPLAARIAGPPLAGPVIRATLTLLADLLAPANMSQPALYALINTTQVRLSIAHGHTDVSAYTYVVYGYFLATTLGRYAEAAEFGRFALELNESLGNTGLRCRIRFVFATYAHFIRPLREVLGELEVALADGRDSGDYIYLSSACSHILILELSLGIPLAMVAERADRFLELMGRTRVASSIASQQVARQVVAALRGETLAPARLDSGDFDEAEFTAACTRSGRTFALRWYATAALGLAVITGDRPRARELLGRFGPAIRGSYAFFFATEFAVFACLALCDLAGDDPPDRRPEHLRELAIYREAIDAWAEACPANYAAKAALIAAEVASLAGDPGALQAYEGASAGAAAEGLTPLLAIACERAAAHCQRQGLPSLRVALLQRAAAAYARWGASRRVEELHRVLHELGQGAEVTAPEAAAERPRELDFRGLLRASQALASPLGLADLVPVIMRVVPVISAATRALLIVDDGAGGLWIAGSSAGDGGSTVGDEGERPLAAAEAPVTVVRLTLRTLRPVAPEDPEHRGLLELDPYLQRVGPRSALCVPLVSQGRASGALYLENRAVAGIFTRARRAALGLLSAQIAISLEHTRLYTHLERTREAAESANRAKSTFLANMSHELRTPLTAILGYAELIAEESEERGETGSLADLERIRGAGLHLLEVVGDILDLSKIEADKLELRVEEFKIAELLAAVVVAVRPTIERRGNTMVFDPPPGLGVMRSDPLRLRQILLNLLGNAAKFTENGTVTLTVARAEGQLRVVVRDTGIGIAPAALERIFDAFQQADGSATRAAGGTGLGLTISRRLCELLGGGIAVASTPGEGSRFTVDLPLDRSSAPAPDLGLNLERSRGS